MSISTSHLSSSQELFLAACQNQKTHRPPIWLMRQAGRYMEQYRQLKEKYDFLTLCKTPELALQVTLQPINRFDMDAAILFSDILTPLEPMGMDIGFSDQGGPRLQSPQNPFLLQTYDIDQDLSYVPDTIKLIKKELPDKAVLGFCGAPFTLAAYILEQGHKKAFHTLRIAIAQEPEKVKNLLSILARQMGQYLGHQILAGVNAVQIFDSWAGNLPEKIFDEFALPYERLTITTMTEFLQKHNPQLQKGKDFFTILFIKDYKGPWEKLLHSQTDIISVDENASLEHVRKNVSVPLQGNLSSYDLFKTKQELENRIEATMNALQSKGHIFNLGHGILPKTPEENVEFLVQKLKSKK